MASGKQLLTCQRNYMASFSGRYVQMEFIFLTYLAADTV